MNAYTFASISRSRQPMIRWTVGVSILRSAVLPTPNGTDSDEE